jgi:hypothetical protein
MTPFRQYGRALLCERRLAGCGGLQVGFCQNRTHAPQVTTCTGCSESSITASAWPRSVIGSNRRRGGALHPVPAGSRDEVKLRAGDAFGAAP